MIPNYATRCRSMYEEFKAFAAEDGRMGVQAAKAGQIDLVIMDVGLPDIDGHEAVRILRKNGFTAPIIMLTGHDTDSDTILGLDSGADDYVTKPFRFAVLLARIRAQLRQHETSDAVFTIGGTIWPAELRKAAEAALKLRHSLPLNTSTVLPQGSPDDAKLGKVSPDRIDHRGLLPDEQMARAMEHQPALLLGRLDWHKPHIGSCDRLTDGLCVGRIVLLPFDVRLDVGRRHQPHGMAKCLQLA
jgi:CheY-like chemotaxis protein